MADTAVATTNVVSLVKNVAVVLPAPQAVTTGNVAVITPAAGSITGTPSVGTQAQVLRGRYVLVQMTESGSVATSTATVKAGPTGGTPANQAAAGDLAAVTFTSGQVKYVVLEAARFLQANGTLRIAVGGASGSVSFNAVILDKNA